MDIQGRRLTVHRLDHAGVAVTDAGHVVVDVQVALAVGVEEPHTLAAHRVQRFVVEQRGLAAERALAALQERLLRHGRYLPGTAGAIASGCGSRN
ncbi:hypothetical protein D3C80_1844700 [compost metagenome]